MRYFTFLEAGDVVGVISRVLGDGFGRVLAERILLLMGSFDLVFREDGFVYSTLFVPEIFRVPSDLFSGISTLVVRSDVSEEFLSSWVLSRLLAGGFSVVGVYSDGAVLDYRGLVDVVFRVSNFVLDNKTYSEVLVGFREKVPGVVDLGSVVGFVRSIIENDVIRPLGGRVVGRPVVRIVRSGVEDESASRSADKLSSDLTGLVSRHLSTVLEIKDDLRRVISYLEGLRGGQREIMGGIRDIDRKIEDLRERLLSALRRMYVDVFRMFSGYLGAKCPRLVLPIEVEKGRLRWRVKFGVYCESPEPHLVGVAELSIPSRGVATFARVLAPVVRVVASAVPFLSLFERYLGSVISWLGSDYERVAENLREFADFVENYARVPVVKDTCELLRVLSEKNPGFNVFGLLRYDADAGRWLCDKHFGKVKISAPF